MNRSTHPARLRANPLAAALLLAIAVPAIAQERRSDNIDKTFEPVEVVGQEPTKPSSPKLTAPLLDTPQTISVVPSAVFAAQGAQNLTDVLRNTPGISFSAGENGFATNNNNFNLRGFDTSGSIFIDGVRDSGNYPRDVFNIEQVEVAKGPAADNGRGGLGGYVNLVTKTPQLGSFLRATTSFGFDGGKADVRLRGSADLNQQLSETSAFRINVLAVGGGVAGRQHAESDAGGIAPSVAFGLGTDTRITLSGQYLDQSGRPDWGVPGAAIRGTINYNPVAGSAPRDAFYGLHSDFDDNLSKSALLRIEHDFSPDLTLSNVIRWADTERTALYTVPFGYTAATQQVVGQTQAYQRDNNALANLTNLRATFSTGSVQHTLSTGVEFSREESDALRFGTITPPTTGVLDPNYLRAALALPAAQQTAGVDIKTVAAYLYDTVRFSDAWQLTGGVRVERYEVDISSHTAAGVPTGPNGYSVSDTTVSGKLGLVYKPTENGSIYLSYGIATLPPGSWLSNPDISRTGDNAFPGLVGQNNDKAKPQRAVNAELGVKWNFFDDRLMATAAVFQTERRDVAVIGKEPGVATSPTILRGYGKQVVNGVELSITGQITDAWSIFAGAVVLDSERQLSDYLAAAHRQANLGDYGTVLSVDGDELAFTPKRSGNIWTTYNIGHKLTVGAGVQHVSESWAGRPDDADRIIPNGRFGKLPGYTIGNVMVSYAFNDLFTLRFNANNVTNREYATSGNWAMTRAFTGPERSYVVSGDFRFW